MIEVNVGGGTETYAMIDHRSCVELILEGILI